MYINISTDSSIKNSLEYNNEIEKINALITNSLHHFQKYISSVEVHLANLRPGKIGLNDKRCLIEVRIKGLNSIIVSHHADNLVLALDGATNKLKRSLKNTFEKLRKRRVGAF